MAIDDSLLAGAFDLHVHAPPSAVPRVQSLGQIVDEAAAAGMAGLLIKDQALPTVGPCQAMMEARPGCPRLISAVALNPPLGGLNPTAAEAALVCGTDVVYFPTYGAANHIGRWGAGLPPTAYPLGPEDKEGLTILDRAGRLAPRAGEILDLIARHKAVVATGHLAPAESLALLREAKARGIEARLVTHASQSVTPLSPAEQAEAAGLGAFIEHCFFAVTESCPDKISLAQMAAQIRRVGVDKVILSSDFGQPANGPVVAGFAKHLDLLGREGFSRAELRTMIVDNPRRLLEGRP